MKLQILMWASDPRGENLVQKVPTLMNPSVAKRIESRRQYVIIRHRRLSNPRFQKCVSPF